LAPAIACVIALVGLQPQPASAAPGPSSTRSTGVLVLKSKGLPPGQRGLVRLSGGGRKKAIHLTAHKTLKLPAGHYVMTVMPVRISATRKGVEAGAVAYPSRRRSRVVVKSGARTFAVAGYAGVVNPATRPLPGNTLGFIGNPEDPRAILLPARGEIPGIGTIFVGGSSAALPRGLISKVTAARKRGSRYVVSLTAVPITDAVPSLEYEGSLAFQPVDTSGSAGVADALAHASSACSPPKLLKFGAHLDSFEVRQASLGAWPPQMRLTLAIRTTESMGLAAVAAGINCDWSLAELGPYQAAIPVGPIVVPVYATIPVKAGVHINGKLNAATINIASTTVASTAAGFDDNHANLSQQGSNVWTSGVLSLSGSAKLSASIGVQAGVGVAKGANVHVKAGFGPDFEWSSGHNCSVHVDLGSLSAGVTVLGKSLNTPSWTPIRPQLWSGCAPGAGKGGESGGGGGGGSGNGGGGSGSGGGGGGPTTGPDGTVYHRSAEGPYSGPPPEPNEPESPLLSVGYDNGCAIAVSKAVRCFGSQLELSNETPPAGAFQEVSVGGAASCGVKTDSTLACWGWIRPGEPSASVGPPPAGSFRSVSVGLVDICAVDTQYILTCWGREGSEDSAAEAAAVPDPGRYTEVSAGWNYACGIHTDGTLACWGEGTPGGGETAPPSGTFREISVSEEEACALSYLNDVVCWGDFSGRLQTHPGPFAEVDTGDGWACARRADGSPSCFVPVEGYNPDLTFAPREGTYSDLSLGRPGVCGRHDDGSVTCWGEAYAGQVTPAPGSFTGLMAGDSYTCGLRSDRSVSCWGNTDGESSTRLDGSFLQIAGAGNLNFYPHLCGVEADHTLSCLGEAAPIGSFEEVAVSEEDACAIATGSGSVSCWSKGGAIPAPVPPSGDFTQISGGGFGPWSRYCALRSDHTLACWQSPGNTIPGATPPAGQFSKVAVGSEQTDCAIHTDGTLSCWKPGSYAGPGEPPAGTFVDVAVAGQAACAIRTGGTITCWGGDDYGETDHPGGTFTQIVAGAHHMCALRSDGSVACWGHGDVLPAG
jgi:hypothetical protein